MEVTPNPQAPYPTVINFDGRVLEFFFSQEQTGSDRYHLSHLAFLQFAPDKKGRPMLEFKTKSGRPISIEVAPAQVTAVQGLVAAIQQALARPS